jgi:hypothetical protein
MVGTIWPFGPNLRRGPYEVIREYRTDIITSRSGREQRRALRQTPRKRIEYITARKGDCLREFDQSMASAQRALLSIPDRVRFVRLTSGIAGGSDAVVVDPVPAWIVVGAPLILVAPDRYGARTVLDVTGTTVTFEEFDDAAWPTNTRLHPALSGYLDVNIDSPVVARTHGITEAKIVFHVNTGDGEGIDGAGFEDDGSALVGSVIPVLNGTEIFLQQPDRFDPMNRSMAQNGLGEVDYGFGRSKRFFAVDFATRLWNAQYTSADFDCAEELRQLFERKKGKRGEFYMPTWQADMVAASDILSGNDTLTVDGSGVFTACADSTVFKAIAVRKTDGNWITREIASIAQDYDTSIITFTEAWNQNISITSIDKICWLPVWRFASDILTMNWPFEDVAQTTLSLQMIENLGPDSPVISTSDFDLDVYSNGVTDIDFVQTWVHTPIGTPRGVIVLLTQATGGGVIEPVQSVFYGSVEMTEVSGSPNIKTTGERGSVFCYFLGSGIPTGPQTVTVNGNIIDTTSRAQYCYTLSASGDTVVQDVQVISSDSLSDPSVTLSLAGNRCFCALAFVSGIPDPANIFPLNNWTIRQEIDHGSLSSGGYSFDSIGTADVTAGWTQTADDAVAIAIAVRVA